eukprot:6730637-Prorocentrum_lima.AAC.1
MGVKGRVHVLLKAMRNMMNRRNTKNQNGMKKERPTMPQHKNGMHGDEEWKREEEDPEGYDEED